MPVGAILLLLQGFPELFRAFHQMGRERERKFVEFLPYYFAGLLVVAVAVFFPNVVPIAVWWTSPFERDGLLAVPKLVIGLITLAAMLFAIFIGFPISFF